MSTIGLSKRKSTNGSKIEHFGHTVVVRKDASTCTHLSSTEILRASLRWHLMQCRLCPPVTAGLSACSQREEEHFSCVYEPGSSNSRPGSWHPSILRSHHMAADREVIIRLSHLWLAVLDDNETHDTSSTCCLNAPFSSRHTSDSSRASVECSIA